VTNVLAAAPGDGSALTIRCVPSGTPSKRKKTIRVGIRKTQSADGDLRSFIGVARSRFTNVPSIVAVAVSCSVSARVSFGPTDAPPRAKTRVEPSVKCAHARSCLPTIR
jgi:hypothetical protein